MIRSTSVTAVQVALNPQPLPPKAVFAPVKAGFNTLNSQQLVVSWESVKAGAQGGAAGASKRTYLQHQIGQKEARADGGNVLWGTIFGGPIIGTAIGNSTQSDTKALALRGWDDKFGVIKNLIRR